jgi:transposase InsO family protein
VSRLLLDRLPSIPKTTNSRHSLPVFHNLVKGLEVSAPNQAWAADITYIRTAEGFLYLSLLMDIWSRKIVGYHAGIHWKAKAPSARWTWRWRNSRRGCSPYIMQTAADSIARIAMSHASPPGGSRSA